MVAPLVTALAPTALGMLGSFFGSKKKGLTSGDINSAYRAGTSSKFKFNPNADDPALKLQQIRAGNLYRRNRDRDLNETYRGGLQNSSIARRSSQGVDSDYARQLEELQYGNLADQRQEQLGMFNSDQDYMRMLQKMRLEALTGVRSAEQTSRGSSIASLGETGGALFSNYLNSRRPRDQYQYPIGPQQG